MAATALCASTIYVAAIMSEYTTFLLLLLLLPPPLYRLPRFRFYAHGLARSPICNAISKFGKQCNAILFESTLSVALAAAVVVPTLTTTTAAAASTSVHRIEA